MRMAAAMNRMAYIWLVAEEAFEHTLAVTMRRLLKHGKFTVPSRITN